MAEDFKEKLEQKANELVQQALPFSWSFVSLEELEKRALYLQPGLPRNKPLGSLILEGVGTVADGGTIVANTREVGPIKILSVEPIENETHIKYQLEKHTIALTKMLLAK